MTQSRASQNTFSTSDRNLGTNLRVFFSSCNYWTSCKLYTTASTFSQALGKASMSYDQVPVSGTIYRYPMNSTLQSLEWFSASLNVQRTVIWSMSPW
jgi:hypothetical protein